MARRSKVEALPPEVRAWLERALVENNFAEYELLEELLGEKGYAIGKSSINRYGQKLQRRLAAIKASTEAARLISEHTADEKDARSEAVLGLIQTEMFDSIINLQEASEEEVDPMERMALLSKAAKNIATMTRASIALKKHQADVAARVAAKMAELEAEAKGGTGRHIDPETLRIVREEIYGIVRS